MQTDDDRPWRYKVKLTYHKKTNILISSWSIQSSQSHKSRKQKAGHQQLEKSKMSCETGLQFQLCNMKKTVVLNHLWSFDMEYIIQQWEYI